MGKGLESEIKKTIKKIYELESDLFCSSTAKNNLLLRLEEIDSMVSANDKSALFIQTTIRAKLFVFLSHDIIGITRNAIPDVISGVNLQFSEYPFMASFNYKRRPENGIDAESLRRFCEINEKSDQKFDGLFKNESELNRKIEDLVHFYLYSYPLKHFLNNNSEQDLEMLISADPFKNDRQKLIRGVRDFSVNIVDFWMEAKREYDSVEPYVDQFFREHINNCKDVNKKAIIKSTEIDSNFNRIVKKIKTEVGIIFSRDLFIQGGDSSFVATFIDEMRQRQFSGICQFVSPETIVVESDNTSGPSGTKEKTVKITEKLVDYLCFGNTNNDGDDRFVFLLSLISNTIERYMEKNEGTDICFETQKIIEWFSPLSGDRAALYRLGEKLDKKPGERPRLKLWVQYGFSADAMLSGACQKKPNFVFRKRLAKRSDGTYKAINETEGKFQISLFPVLNNHIEDGIVSESPKIMVNKIKKLIYCRLNTPLRSKYGRFEDMKSDKEIDSEINEMIKMAIRSGAEYFLTLNSDDILEHGLSNIQKALENINMSIAMIGFEGMKDTHFKQEEAVFRELIRFFGYQQKKRK